MLVIVGSWSKWNQILTFTENQKIQFSSSEKDLSAAKTTSIAKVCMSKGK